MNIENLKGKLREVGIDAEEVTITKNGVLCMGMRIVTDNDVSPVIYYSSEETIEAVVERCMQAKDATIPMEKLQLLQSPEYIMNHVRVCVQKRSDEQIIKRELLNVEAILRVVACNDSDGCLSIKVTPEFASSVGLTEEELWKAAEEIAPTTFEIRSIASVMGFPEEVMNEMPMYIVGTKDKTFGAGALAFPEIFRNFCNENDENACVILPSSTEELIILPESFATRNCCELANLVRDVNDQEVDEALQLEPCIYYYDVDSNSISILAVAE